MLLSKINNTGQNYLFENTSSYKLTQSYNDYESNIEAELAKLKEEEKLLQTVLEIKIRGELINHLERDKEVESIKNNSVLNNSMHLTHTNQDPDLEVKNMTTTHSLLHRITNECPICEKNSINSLIISSGNERNLNKTNSGVNIMPKFQNKPEPEKPKPNVIFSKAYKSARPLYVTNLKTLIQTPIIKDIDSNLRLSYNEAALKTSSQKPTRAKSTSDLNRSVQFEKSSLDSAPRTLTAANTSERDYAIAFRDNHFYGKKRHTTGENEKLQAKFIQLPVTKTLVHDRAWGYGKNYTKDFTTYYPFRDSHINKLKK